MLAAAVMSEQREIGLVAAVADAVAEQREMGLAAAVACAAVMAERFPLNVSRFPFVCYCLFFSLT